MTARKPKIAWSQCAGSRDTKSGNPYCSSICCMAMTKKALVANEHTAGLEATIFNMDIRLRYTDEQFKTVERDFDLVALAVGLDPKPGISKSMAHLGINP
jgi:hypothetical protein